MYKHVSITITNNIYYTFLPHDGGGVTPPRKLLTKLTQTTMRSDSNSHRLTNQHEQGTPHLSPLGLTQLVAEEEVGQR